MLKPCPKWLARELQRRIKQYLLDHRVCQSRDCSKQKNWLQNAEPKWIFSPKKVPFAWCTKLSFGVASSSASHSRKASCSSLLPPRAPLRLGTADQVAVPSQVWQASVKVLSNYDTGSHGWQPGAWLAFLPCPRPRKCKQPSHSSWWYLNNGTAMLWAGFITLGKRFK